MIDTAKLLEEKLAELDKTRLTTVETFTTLDLFQSMNKRENVNFTVPDIEDNRGIFLITVDDWPINIEVFTLNAMQTIYTATDPHRRFFKAPSKVSNDKLTFVKDVLNSIGGQ